MKNKLKYKIFKKNTQYFWESGDKKCEIGVVKKIHKLLTYIYNTKKKKGPAVFCWPNSDLCRWEPNGTNKSFLFF